LETGVYKTNNLVV